MSIEERIKRLQTYRRAVVDWDESTDPRKRREIRSLLNQSKHAVQRDVLEAGCLKTLTITPPPAVGGLIMRNVDPFDAMFEPPYLMNLVPPVLDMIDEAIGVISSPEFAARDISQAKAAVAVQDDFREGYVFIAMPMTPESPELEDVLDAIKEACTRCGLHAERVDEPQSNERITDRILESIRSAQYVVVDLTGARPNVFYEAGYAQGRGKTPIYIARSGTQVEFDLKDYPVIFFRSMKELKDSLERRLRGLAAQGPET